MIACRSIGRLLSLSYVITRVRVCACQERTRERERRPCAPHQSIISAGNKIWKNVIPRKVENAITLNRICNLHPILAESRRARTTTAATDSICDAGIIIAAPRNIIFIWLRYRLHTYIRARISSDGDRRIYVCRNNVTEYVRITWHLAIYLSLSFSLWMQNIFIHIYNYRTSLRYAMSLFSLEFHRIFDNARRFPFHDYTALINRT